MTVKNIVLLHGWGADTKKLLPLKRELEKFGWTVMLPKLAGFESPAPKEVWGIKEYSEYVVDEAKKIFGDSKYFIFGHSFGGGIVIKLASENPRKLNGIILCATRGISRGKSVKRLVFALLAKTGKVFLVTPKVAEKFRKLLYKAAREHDYEKTQGIMKEIFKKVISEDLKPLVPKIKVPVLIFWGDTDRVTPITDAYFIMSTLKGSKLITFKNQGHKLPYEKPQRLAKEINLWSTLRH